MINLELGSSISADLKTFIIRDSDNSHKHNANIAESRSGDTARTEAINLHRITLNNLDNGVYHYEIQFASKQKSVGKITILN